MRAMAIHPSASRFRLSLGRRHLWFRRCTLLPREIGALHKWCLQILGEGLPQSWPINWRLRGFVSDKGIDKTKNTKHLVDVTCEWPQREKHLCLIAFEIFPLQLCPHIHVFLSTLPSPVFVYPIQLQYFMFNPSSVWNWHERNGKKSDQQTCYPSTFPIRACRSARDNNSGCGDVQSISALEWKPMSQTCFPYMDLLGFAHRLCDLAMGAMLYKFSHFHTKLSTSISQRLSSKTIGTSEIWGCGPWTHLSDELWEDASEGRMNRNSDHPRERAIKLYSICKAAPATRSPMERSVRGARLK